MTPRSRFYLRLILSTTLTLWASTALALGRYNGIAQRGSGTAVRNISGTTVKVTKAYPGATITVYTAGTVTLATLASDAGGTSKSNPFTAASDASYFFYANAGCYDIKTVGTDGDTFTVSSECVSDTTDVTNTSAVLAYFAATEQQRAVMGNDTSKPMSTYYATQALAEAAYEETTTEWSQVGCSPCGIPLTTELETVVLQEAILELTAVGGGLITDGRSGTYRVSREVNWKRRVSFKGDGMDATIWKTSATTGHICFDFDGTSSEFDVSIEDVGLNMDSFEERDNTVPDSTVIGFKVHKNVNTLRNVRIINVPRGGIGISNGGYGNSYVGGLIDGPGKNSGGTTHHATGLDLTVSAASGSNAVTVDHIGITEFPGVRHATNDSGAAIRWGGGALASSGSTIRSCYFDANDIGVFGRNTSSSDGSELDIGPSNRFEGNETAVSFQDGPTATRVFANSFGSASATSTYYIVFYGSVLTVSNNSFGLAASAGASLLAACRREADARFDSYSNNMRTSGTLPIISDGNTSRAFMYVDTTSNATTGGSLVGIRVPRYSTSTSAASTTGLSHSGSNYNLTASFGATGSIAVNNANDSAGRVTITANGGGCSNPPTLTVTFALAYTAAPRAVIVTRGGSSGAGTAAANFIPSVSAISTTAFNVQIVDANGAAGALPCGGETIGLQFWVIE